MVHDAIRETGRMDNAWFRVTDGELAEVAVGHTPSPDITPKLVDMVIEALEKAPDLMTRVLAAGGTVRCTRQIVEAGNSVERDRGPFHD